MSKFAELSSTMQYVMDDVQTTAARRLTNISNLQVALELFENSTIVNYNGGLFVVSQNLIGFVNGLLTGTESAIVLDAYTQPIEIGDLKEFLKQLIEAYNKGVKKYSERYYSTNWK
jgi:hypothetical protein